MKMKFTIVMVMFFLISSNMVVFANTNVGNDLQPVNEVAILIPIEKVEEDEQSQIDFFTRILNNSRSQSRSIIPYNIEYDYEYISRKVGNPIDHLENIGYAGNQPLYGTSFSSPGGFYWEDGGYNTNISFGLSIGYFSISVSSGKVNAISGRYISSPYINTPVKLYIQKTIRTQKYVVYRRDISNGSETYYSERFTHTPIIHHLSVRKINY